MASINIFIHEMWTADFYYTVVSVLVFCLSADHEDSHYREDMYGEAVSQHCLSGGVKLSH
jgi:hypothetical protein